MFFIHLYPRTLNQGPHALSLHPMFKSFPVALRCSKPAWSPKTRIMFFMVFLWFFYEFNLWFFYGLKFVVNIVYDLFMFFFTFINSIYVFSMIFYDLFMIFLWFFFKIFKFFCFFMFLLWFHGFLFLKMKEF